MVLPHNGAPQCGQISSGISPGSQMSLVQEREHCRQVSLPQGAVIRRPFEKTVRFNKKSCFYRVNAKFAQLAEETDERSVSVAENSVDWVSAMLKTL